MLQELLTRPTVCSALALASARRLLRDVNSQRQTTKFIAERGFRQHPCAQLPRNFYDCSSRLSDSGRLDRGTTAFQNQPQRANSGPCVAAGMTVVGGLIKQPGSLDCLPVWRTESAVVPKVLRHADCIDCRRSFAFPGSGQMALWYFARR